MNIERPDGHRSHHIVFSDLDQTLLDGQDYSYDKAIPGLALLEAQAIPLVLCTSKTRPEVEFHRRHLNNRHPFVVENGGAIYIPTDYYGFEFDYDRRVDDYFVLELGVPYRKLVRTLAELKTSTGLPLRGFSDMSIHEIASLCNLSLLQAAWAKQRDYDEPFLIPETSAIDAIINACPIPLTQGGRFFHLASSDKGRTVSILMTLFRRCHPGAVSVGIGDAFNDLPMLEAVDIPILVQDTTGAYDPEIAFSRLRYADGIGPAGWNAAIANLFDGAATGLTR